jgi:hypothetical protein
MLVDLQSSSVSVIATVSASEGRLSVCNETICGTLGYYEPNKSSTVGSTTVYTEWGGGAMGGWGTTEVSTDTVTIGGTKVKDVPLVYKDIIPVLRKYIQALAKHIC